MNSREEGVVQKLDQDHMTVGHYAHFESETELVMLQHIGCWQQHRLVENLGEDNQCDV
jgi:hypothetical protein